MSKTTHLSNLFTKLDITNLASSHKGVEIKRVSWNNKPVLPHSILVWDLENISFRQLNSIKNKVAYSPEKLYLVTKQKISKRNRSKMQNEGFKILSLHKGVSDEKIISIIKIYSMYSNMILISSDSDFVNIAKRYLKNNKLQWIMQDKNKKRILMKINIVDKNLKITTI